MAEIAIKEATLTYAETVNLGDYENIKPSLSVVVEGVTRDEMMEVFGNLRVSLHGVIDDELEARNRPPRYTEEDLYKIIISKKRRVVCVVPDHVDIDYNGPLSDFGRDRSTAPRARWGYCIAHARRIASEAGYGLIEVRDDAALVDIPPLPEEFSVLTSLIRQCVVLVKADDVGLLPDDFNERKTSVEHIILEDFGRHQKSYENALDCRGGFDISMLPEVLPTYVTLYSECRNVVLLVEYEEGRTWPDDYEQWSSGHVAENILRDVFHLLKHSSLHVRLEDIAGWSSLEELTKSVDCEDPNLYW